jgi:nucleoside-diphosphate-sugar epimerase/predicted dehydrogenase
MSSGRLFASDWISGAKGTRSNPNCTAVVSAHNYVMLGGGSVTAEYYLPALTILGLADRTTVVDPSDGSLEALRCAFTRVNLLRQDHREFFAAQPPAGQRVIVALPNHLHIEAVEQALSSGHHVLCEKPLCLKAADCARLEELAATKARALKVAMSRRYLPSLMLAREVVLAREFGDLLSIEIFDCAPFPWRPKSFAFFAPGAGGVLADMGVHYLDYVETLLGPLEPSSYEDDSRGGNEANLKYELKAGAVPVSLRLSRLDPAGSFIRLQCERGDIRVEKAHEREIFVTPANGSSRRVICEQPFPSPDWPRDFHGSFCAMLQDFDAAIAGKENRLASAEDAARTAALIEWAYENRSRILNARSSAVRPSGSDVLITGATGFIGGHLVARLAEQGIRIRAAVRSPASCANVARYPLEIAPVDLLDSKAVGQAVAGVRRIFHLAYGREGADAAAVTVQGTKNLVEAAIAAQAEAIVILSTMYVFGFPSGAGPVNESFPYRPYGREYGASKAKMERWCLERAKRSGSTRIVVLNPTCIFGPGGGAYTRLPVQLARAGQFCWIDDGSGVCNFTYVSNVIDAMLLAAESPAAHGERFIINDGNMSWREFITPLVAPLDAAIGSYSVEAFKALPRFGPPFHMKDLVGAALRSSEFRAVVKRSAAARKLIAAMRDSPFAHRTAAESQPAHTSIRVNGSRYPDLPPDWLLDLYPPFNCVFSSDKARKLLNWSPVVDYAVARDETVRWLNQAGYYASYAA